MALIFDCSVRETRYLLAAHYLLGGIVTTWAFGSSTDLLALLSRRPSHSSQLATSWFTWQRVRPEWYLCMCCMGLDVPLRASGVGNRFHVPHLMARLLACSDKSARLYGFGVFGGITDRIHLVLGSSTGWFWVVHPQAGHIRATHLVLTRNRPRASMLRVGDP